MEYPGTVHGEAARLYAGYTYRKPVMAPVDIWQIDPERLHPAHEYPRNVNPPSQPNTQTVDLADYVVRIGASGIDGMIPVQVWMQPNEHTSARKALLVCEFMALNALTLQHEYRAEAEQRAFVKPNVRAKRADTVPRGKSA
jgi:hypothetical protein